MALAGALSFGGFQELEKPEVQIRTKGTRLGQYPAECGYPLSTTFARLYHVIRLARAFMIDGLKPPSARPMPCKICSGDTVLYGVVDFHKSCAEERGVRLPLSGIPIYYRRCAACKFLFTDAFDTWSTEQFVAHVYNADYLAVDPHYQVLRPRENGASVARLWGPYRAETRVLDYGGGSDVLCGVLRAAGFPMAVTYDPMIPDYARRPDGKFELITCFETLEHLPDPAAGVAEIIESAPANFAICSRVIGAFLSVSSKPTCTSSK